MIRALIIEDEPHAQRELQRLLEDLSQSVSVVAIADSVEEAIVVIEAHREVDIIFMDIQLSDGLSFDIFERIEVTSPVVFTTAFDEYAIRAFKVNSVDYLLKPVMPEALQAAVDKFVQHSNPKVDFEKLIAAFTPAKSSYRERWAVRVGEKLKRFTQEDIAYFYADDDALYLVPNTGPAVIIEGTLQQMCETLDPKHFFQISRKLIISYPCIQKVEKYGSSQYALEVHPSFPERVLVSRSRMKDFNQWLNQ
ncbi:MAG: response regulator transcription factor [Bacteroidetes bacterium]|nr:MAG: response regulator transcription factor [Bacteroidota bacterium]